ncbi:MAG: hypothetical protein WC763_06515 [Candidatus Paceibacterota bacterium]
MSRADDYFGLALFSRHPSSLLLSLVARKAKRRHWSIFSLPRSLSIYLSSLSFSLVSTMTR